ncbi:MAG: ribonuclease HII [Chloroflexi bacterium]|nr:ribonuclease HII [Chloroflexota bacterium]
MSHKFNKELLPPAPDLSFESVLWEQDLHYIAGIDEAGRGALAGDVAAAAVIFSRESNLEHILAGVRDSKQMSPAQREYWSQEIKITALAWAVGFASNLEIDSLGIAPATRLAIHRALESLPIKPEHLLVDYIKLPDCTIPQTPLVKGDARSLSIAAASVIAKTARDELMRHYERSFPGYGFAKHKGYGTASHRIALQQLGASPLHRCSFAPLKQMKIPGENHE